MIGTTFKWWRAAVYLAVLVGARAKIATYIAPWVPLSVRDLLIEPPKKLSGHGPLHALPGPSGDGV
jgi:hypothetical protein